jgi:hypothetical protein
LRSGLKFVRIFSQKWGIEIPVAVSAFPDEIYTYAFAVTVRAAKRIRLSHGAAELGGARGSHFAAWEQPQQAQNRALP